MHPKNKLLIPILVLLVILPMVATDIYLPALPAIGSQLGVDENHLTVSLASYMLGYSVSLLFAGILADIYGRRPIAIIGLSMFVVSSIGCLFASSIEQLVSWRFFQALGGGSGTLISRIIVRDLYDQQSQVRVLSYLATGLVVSPTLGPIIGAYVSNYFGWRAIFVVLVCISLFLLTLLYFFMRETLVRDQLRGSFCFEKISLRWLTLWGNREFAFNTLVISFAWAIYFTFISASPILIQNLHQMSPIEYSFLLSTTIGGFIFGTIFIRWKIANFNLRYLITISSLIILISTLMLYIVILLDVEALKVKLFFVFFTLFGIGIIFPATQAGVTRPFKDDIGLVSGFFYSTEMFFGAVCGYLLSCMGVVGWENASLMMLISAVAILSIIGLDKFCGVNHQDSALKIHLK